MLFCGITLHNLLLCIKKNFDLPSALVEFTDGISCPGHLIGDEFYDLLIFIIPYCNSPKPFWILVFGLIAA